MFGKPKKKKRIERTWRKKESLMATIKKWQYRDNIKSQVEDTNNSMAKNEKAKNKKNTLKKTTDFSNTDDYILQYK